VNNRITEQITLDVERTLVENDQFVRIPDRSARLFDILKAYALYDSEVGYCQGMANIVACLMTQITVDEEVFWTFVAVMKDYKMADYYEPKMRGFLRDAVTFYAILRSSAAILAKHLDMSNVNVLLYIAPWFLSLYANLPDWELVLCIFDFFFVEGTRAVLRFALGILRLCADDICRLTGVEEVLPYLLNIPAKYLTVGTLGAAAIRLDMQALVEQADNVRPTDDESLDYLATFPASPATPKTVKRHRVADAPTTPVKQDPQRPSIVNKVLSSLPTPIRKRASSSFFDGIGDTPSRFFEDMSQCVKRRRLSISQNDITDFFLSPLWPRTSTPTKNPPHTPNVPLSTTPLRQAATPSQHGITPLQQANTPRKHPSLRPQPASPSSGTPMRRKKIRPRKTPTKAATPVKKPLTPNKRSHGDDKENCQTANAEKQLSSTQTPTKKSPGVPTMLTPKKIRAQSVCLFSPSKRHHFESSSHDPDRVHLLFDGRTQ